MQAQNEKTVEQQMARITEIRAALNHLYGRIKGLVEELGEIDAGNTSSSSPNQLADIDTGHLRRHIDEIKSFAKVQVSYEDLEDPSTLDSTATVTPAESGDGDDDDDNDDDDKSMQCTGCMEPASSAVTAPCGHRYCGACLVLVMDSATPPDCHFPPTCCGEAVPWKLALPFVGRRAARRYRLRAAESATPIADRLYCRRCSAFVRRRIVYANRAFCPACDAFTTCVGCREHAHDGPCPRDAVPGARELDKVAAREGWLMCPSCRRYIDRIAGCEFVKCRCGMEVCFECRRPRAECVCEDLPEATPETEPEEDPVPEPTDEEMEELLNTPVDEDVPWDVDQMVLG